MAVKIVTDSTSDIPRELGERLGVEVVPLKVLFGEREYVDGADMTPEEFYALLRAAEQLPTTVQVGPEQFRDVFKRHLDAGDQILGIFLSSEMSGTFQSAGIARDMLGGAGIVLVDSRNVSFALAAQVYEAVRLRDKGWSAAEIGARLEEIRDRVVLLGMVNTLKYLKMGGRLSATSALLGGMLNIKPIVTVRDGKMAVAGKARGQAAAFRDMARKVLEDRPDPEFGMVLAHSDARGACEALREHLKCAGCLAEPERCREQMIGSVVGTHAGPGCAGVSYLRRGE